MTLRSYLHLFRLREGYRKYRFEFRHLAVLVLVLISFQFVVLILNQHSLQRIFARSQQWYQQDAAERIANLTATSLEMLLESKPPRQQLSQADAQQIIQDFNIIFSQQLLEKNVQTVCILIPRDSTILALDNGQDLYNYLFLDGGYTPSMDFSKREAIRLYSPLRERMERMEQTVSLRDDQQVFHVFIPFVPRGEFLGAVYMKSNPDLSFLTREMSANYDQTALVYSGLIIVGLLAMFFISMRTLRERDDAQRLLFEEQKQHLAEQINHEKETMFTKRIYHTHHKAEKISGFIKEDLRKLSPETIEVIKHRIGKYASFVARVIYDMKWYDPPIHTMRGSLFSTDINEVIQFLIENVFRRVAQGRDSCEFRTDLDPALPRVAVNEFVAWEVLEPLIQNALDHANVDRVVVDVRTRYSPDRRETTVSIADNGRGILPDLLQPDAQGVQRIFREHVTSADRGRKEHSGYGCYIAYELATHRLGWRMDAANRPEGGACITLTVPHDADIRQD